MWVSLGGCCLTHAGTEMQKEREGGWLRTEDENSLCNEKQNYRPTFNNCFKEKPHQTNLAVFLFAIFRHRELNLEAYACLASTSLLAKIPSLLCVCVGNGLTRLPR